ncbi:MAG: cupin domain-containing protein [Planctomycetota bacterium]
MNPLLMPAAAAAGALALVATGHRHAIALPNAGSTEQILRRFVEDFRSDPAAATARTFAIRVRGDDGGSWTVEVTGEQADDGQWGVVLRPGEPRTPTFYYALSAAMLVAIDAGRLNALTAQGKAFADEVAPMETEFMAGAEPFDANPFSFHFWTRGFPEKVALDAQLARRVHGVKNIPIYYEQGLRTIWSTIQKGERVNNGPGQPMLVPFPILVVGIKGRAIGTMNGKPVEAKAGEVVFIPPLTPYEWWNEDDEPCEALLVMFGAGA